MELVVIILCGLTAINFGLAVLALVGVWFIGRLLHRTTKGMTPWVSEVSRRLHSDSDRSADCDSGSDSDLESFPFIRDYRAREDDLLSILRFHEGQASEEEDRILGELDDLIDLMTPEEVDHILNVDGPCSEPIQYWRMIGGERGMTLPEQDPDDTQAIIRKLREDLG